MARFEGFGVISSLAQRGDRLPATESPPVVEEVPSETVTLASLVRESGPLPIDAALECLQRVAERLEAAPPASSAPVGPEDILVDDDGEISILLRRSHQSGSTIRNEGGGPSSGELGRLLAYLTTADGGHLENDLEATGLPLPTAVADFVHRLGSRNGQAFSSFAELAREAARLRGDLGGSPRHAEETVPASIPEVRSGRSGFRWGRWLTGLAVLIVLAALIWLAVG